MRTWLSREQKQFLEAKHLAAPLWSKKQVNEYAIQLRLNRTKVYKWHWDRRKRP